MILDFFLKHEKSKNLSPFPKRSPSSNVDGIILFNVSGRKSTNTEPISDKPPSTKAGSGLNIFDYGKKVLCELVRRRFSIKNVRLPNIICKS